MQSTNADRNRADTCRSRWFSIATCFGKFGDDLNSKTLFKHFQYISEFIEDDGYERFQLPPIQCEYSLFTAYNEPAAMFFYCSVLGETLAHINTLAVA